MRAESHAQVYVDRNGTYRILARDYTTMGLGILRVTEVDRVAQPSNEDLGQRVLRALDGAGTVVPHPAQNEWSSFTRSFNRAMGHRSNRALIAANACLFVTREGGSVSITLGTKEDAKGGFTYPIEPDTTIAASPAEIGQAITDLAAHVTFADAD